MITIALVNDDIELDLTGNIRLFDGIKAEQQLVINVIKTIFGEVDLNTNIGVKYNLGESFEPSILVSSLNENLERLDFIDTIKIEKFIIKDRELNFSCEVKNKQGDIYNVNSN